jgi:hypothetical protein
MVRKTSLTANLTATGPEDDPARRLRRALLRPFFAPRSEKMPPPTGPGLLAAANRC